MTVRSLRCQLVLTIAIACQQAAFGQSDDKTPKSDAPAKTVVAAKATDATQPSGRPALIEIRPSDSYPGQIYREAHLVAGGRRAKDPLRKGYQYYAAQRDLYWSNMLTGTTTGKQFGLLLSRDDGQTWQVLSRAFEFQDIFVHPASGELFAIIAYDWIAPEDTGFLQHYYSQKVIRSLDGNRWTDITPKPGYANELIRIFQDPDHPNRICVSGNVIRGVTFQYDDDKFSSWTIVKYMDWDRTHPNPPAEK